MTIAFKIRKTLALAILIPGLAVTTIGAEVAAGLSSAEAQQLQQKTEKEPGNSISDKGPQQQKLPPCRPGTASVAAIDCTPWTPPRRVASSKDDCSCELTYKMVGGQKVAVRDCYVLLPTNEVYYCPNPAIMR